MGIATQRLSKKESAFAIPKGIRASRTREAGTPHLGHTVRHGQRAFLSKAGSAKAFYQEAVLFSGRKQVGCYGTQLAMLFCGLRTYAIGLSKVRQSLLAQPLCVSMQSPNPSIERDVQELSLLAAPHVKR